MQVLILVIHVLVAVALIALILLQQGKGADVGASFGAGAANTMFGSVGAMPFLTKVTAGLAALFFVTSLGLNYLAAHNQVAATEVAQPLSTSDSAVTPFVPSSDSAAAGATTAPSTNNSATQSSATPAVDKVKQGKQPPSAQ